MLDETDYHRRADALLESLAEALEPAFEAGMLDDVECAGGVLTILTEAGKTFVVSKHTATQQVWLASPLSGGLHFLFDPVSQRFVLADGQDIPTLLMRELGLPSL